MKAVLVFCEGRHDVVFAQRSLGAHGGCTWVDKHIGELPSPFGPKGAATQGLITVAGQFNHPGDPMSIVIGRNGIPVAAFEGARTSAELTEFLKQVPWREAPEGEP